MTMALSSPPGSPPTTSPQRPVSALMGLPRTSSRQSIAGKTIGESRYSDEDSKTSVKVGRFSSMEGSIMNFTQIY